VKLRIEAARCDLYEKREESECNGELCTETKRNMALESILNALTVSMFIQLFETWSFIAKTLLTCLISDLHQIFFYLIFIFTYKCSIAIYVYS